MNITRSFLLVFIIVLLFGCKENNYWRGENRDGVFYETDLLQKWPEEGPEMLWHYDSVGLGFSSASVTNSHVYAVGMIDSTGYIFAFNHGGDLEWKFEYGLEWNGDYSGSHTTPVIKKNKLYHLSGRGKLFCLNLKKRKIIWSIDLKNEYKAQFNWWGIQENLLIDKDKIYCTPGAKDAAVIALNKNTGKLIWKSKGGDDRNAYSSPIIIEYPDRKILVTSTEFTIYGIDISDGKQLWQHKVKNDWAHSNLPLFRDDHVYCVDGNEYGGVMIKLSDNGAKSEVIWRDSILTHPFRGGSILLNKNIYGFSIEGELACIDWNTGEKLFSSPSVIKTEGNLIYADNNLYSFLNKKNMVRLIDPSDLSVISSFKTPYGSGPSIADLVIHNKKLYVRRGNSLMVYSIAEK